MNKILFVCSHLYSGSSALCDSLSLNSRIQKFNCGPYVNPLNLIYLTNKKHKLNNRAAIYMDELLYNYQLSIKMAYNECDFIYFISHPRYTINSMINSGIKPLYALRYYNFRLRRICEMAVKTPGSIFLNRENLNLDLLKDYIKEINFEEALPNFSVPHLKEAEECYERTCYFLKNVNLKH